MDIRSKLRDEFNQRVSARSRVFLVEDPKLNTLILDLVAQNKKFRSDYARFRMAIIRRDYLGESNNVPAEPVNPEAPEQILALAQWPLKEESWKIIEGVTVLPKIEAEYTVEKDKAYILVPRAKYYEKRSDSALNQHILAKMQDWSPPVGLTEISPYKFGRCPRFDIFSHKPFLEVIVTQDDRHIILPGPK